MKKNPKQRPRPQQKLSRVQETRVLKIVGVLVVLSLLWIFFAPGSGIMTLFSKKSELKKLQQDSAQIRQQVELLEQDIDRLNNDPPYLEDIARKEHGLLKKNELIYDFSKKPPEKKK